MDVEETDTSNAAAQPKGGDEKAAGGKLHVLGIGGRRAKRGSFKATGTKKTPGEIRIQKGKDTGACRNGLRRFFPDMYFIVLVGARCITNLLCCFA